MFYIKGSWRSEEIYATDLLEGDHINGRQGNDVIYAMLGDDRAWGGNGDDTLWGGGGDDYLSGMAGDDILYGETGINTLAGGKGNDALYLGYEGGSSDGGDGNDTLVFEGSNGIGSAGAGDDTVLVRMDATATAEFTVGEGTDTIIVDQRDEGRSVARVLDWRPGDKISFLAADGRDSLATFDALDTNDDGEIGAGDVETEFGAVGYNAAGDGLVIRFGDMLTGDHVVLVGTLSLDISEVSL